MPIVQAANDTDVRNLLTQLFTTNLYNKLVKPKINQSEPVVVYVDYYLFGINDLNEVEQKLTTTGFLEIIWKDEFLTWEPMSYGNLESLYIPQDDIWKPDISLENGINNLEELGSSFIQVIIESSGFVYWYPFQIFESKCYLDSTYFPFDHQTCDLEFVVWSFDSEDVNLFVKKDGISMNRATNKNGEWNLVASSSMNLTENIESKIRFSITMKRKPLFVVINIIIPIILLSILNIFTFQIPTDTGERMGYTITVWLAFAVFLTIVSASLPKSSDTVPLLSIYIIIQLGVGTITVLISSIESRVVGRSNDQPVAWYLRQIAIKCRRPRVALTDEKINTNASWKDGIDAIDSCLFWCLLVLLAIVTFVIMMIAALSK